MANVKVKASGGAVAKKRGGSLEFDKDAQTDKAKSFIKKASGGGVGCDKSPFSSAGGGGSSKSPFSSARRG